MDISFPLVSVGIPAYNKPEGLRRTLKCITQQTYKNLQIIISDDCSPDKETETVAREFMGKDPRIRYIRQQKNIGAESNFKFLLKKAAGEYFMWAADDDEWDQRFIEVCIQKIGNCSSAMPSYKFVNRAKKREFGMNIPDLSPQYGVYRNLRNYLIFAPSAFMYGFHKRADILWFLKWELFDAWDHHFASKLLLDCNGIMLIRDYCGFTVGIDTEEYIPKPIHPRPGRVFEHYPLFRHDVSLIASSKKLSIIEKIKLVNMVFLVFLDGFANCEKNARPILAKLCRFILVLSKPQSVFNKAFIVRHIPFLIIFRKPYKTLKDKFKNG